MSFEDFESDVEFGAPCETYEFTCGTLRFRYINTETKHPSLPDHEPIPIYREAYKSSGKPDDQTVNIRIPISAALGLAFIDYPPTTEITVKVSAGHLSDDTNEFRVVLIGRVTSKEIEGNECVLSVSSTLVSMKRPGLRRNWQYQCPLLLYGDRCRADKEKQRITTTIAELLPDGYFRPADGWNNGIPHDRFLGGMVGWQSEIGEEWRLIFRVTVEGHIKATGRYRYFEVGQEIQILRGCNHTVDHCREHWSMDTGQQSNIKNYGGQPWIPLKNPIRNHPFW